jgi:integrase
MKYTINLDCKTKTNKNGEFPILLRVSINGSFAYFNTGKRINEKFYDNEEKSIRNNLKGASNYKAFIDNQISIINDLFYDVSKRGDIISAYQLRELYNKKTGKLESKCFFKFVEEYIKEERKLNILAEHTLDNYENELCRLKKFKEKVSIYDFTFQFINEYQSFILNHLCLSKNSNHHSLSFLRKYINVLIRQGLITKTPFTEFKIGDPFLTEVEYLEQDELIKLQKLYDSKELIDIIKKAKCKYAQDFNVGEKYQIVLKYFLMSCYSGLRFSDVITLRLDEIKGNYIVKEMQKGTKKNKKKVRIPLNNNITKLIEYDNLTGYIFKDSLFSNSRTNKLLKEIAKIAGIKKKLTFHCSRHTFAINSLYLGIKLEVISDVLV